MVPHLEPFPCYFIIHMSAINQSLSGRAINRALLSHLNSKYSLPNIIVYSTRFIYFVFTNQSDINYPLLLKSKRQEK